MLALNKDDGESGGMVGGAFWDCRVAGRMLLIYAGAWLCGLGERVVNRMIGGFVMDDVLAVGMEQCLLSWSRQY